MSVDAGQMEKFILIFFRVLGVIAFVPFWRSRSTPARVKIGLSLILAVIFFSVSAEVPFEAVNSIYLMLLLIIKETGLGILIGLVGYMVFAGVEFAGSLAGMQMGLRMAASFDPQFEVQSSPVSQFNGLLALMVLISMNGHHWFIDGVASSFRVIPLGTMELGEMTFDQLIKSFGDIFIIGLKLSAPITIAMLLTNVSLGLMVKAVPQMNVFVIGFPVMLLVGLLVLFISIKVLAYLLSGLFGQMHRDISLIFSGVGR